MHQARSYKPQPMADEICEVPSLVTLVRLYLKRIFMELGMAIAKYRDAISRLMDIGGDGRIAMMTGWEHFRLQQTIGICDAYRWELRQLMLDLRAAFPDSGRCFPI